MRLTRTIVEADAIVENAKDKIHAKDEQKRRRNNLNETITYAGAIWMISGWVAGRIIGMFIINRMDKNNDR